MPTTPLPPAQWLISCDESGIHGGRYYGFGSLWMPWQRRGDFSAAMRELNQAYRFPGELKWKKVHSRYHRYFLEIVDYFFQRRWLAFHCIVVRKGMVDREFHGGSYDLGRRKHFTMLLTNKIRRCLTRQSGREHRFRIWVDPIASSYTKADEAVEVIANNVLAQAFGERRPVDRVTTRDSKATPSIQLCDLLLGAVMDAWQRKAESESKLAVQAEIARHLGWSDLRADTRPEERKFNVWYFHDPTFGPREATSRDVALLYPLD